MSEVTATASYRLSKLAGEELSSLQASNFSSTGDISAHASGVRTLVLRVLKAAISLTKAKPSKQKDQVRATHQCDLCHSPLPAVSESHNTAMAAVAQLLSSAEHPVISRRMDNLPNVDSSLNKYIDGCTMTLLNCAMLHVCLPGKDHLSVLYTSINSSA